MKFLIQTSDGRIEHDFAFTLLESIRFKNWLNHNDKKAEIKVKYINYIETGEPDDIYPIQLKPYHEKYVPVGSVEFVTDFIHHFYGLTVKPINVPEELFHPSFTQRPIINTNELNLPTGKWFVKSNDKIKSFAEVIDLKEKHVLPKGNYQVSLYLTGIDSEWRAFVYNNKLVGLQNYAGDFTLFPNPELIKDMIKTYKSAPVAYTLDVGVRKIGDYHRQTLVIEVHDFFSCGLYGFNDSKYPTMLHQWFWQYIQREMVEQRREKL
jgi:hypothetical protein